MLTLEKTDLPIVNIYDITKIKNYHLEKSTNIYNKVYFNRESIEKNSYDLENSFILPNTKDTFFKILIGGASGSGKTTTISNISTQFLKENNDNAIIIYISPLEYDTHLDEVFEKIGKDNIIKLTNKNFKSNDDKNKLINLLNNNNKNINTNLNVNITMNKSYITGNKLNEEEEEKKKRRELIIKELNNIPFYDLDSLRIFINKYFLDKEILLIFDDIESLPKNTTEDKLIVKMLFNLMFEISVRGRAHLKTEKNINLITVFHNVISGDVNKILKTLINESTLFCISLKATNTDMINKICNKFGLLQYKTILNELKNKGESVCYISTQYPFYISCNSCIYPI